MILTELSTEFEPQVGCVAVVFAVSVQFSSLMVVMMMLVAAIVFSLEWLKRGGAPPNRIFTMRGTFVKHPRCVRCTYIITLVLQTNSSDKQQ